MFFFTPSAHIFKRLRTGPFKKFFPALCNPKLALICVGNFCFA